MLDQLGTFIQEQLQQNDLFKGGLLLMVGGGLLAVLRSVPMKLWRLIKRQSMIVLDIPDRDEAFHWMNIWLSQNSYSTNRARLLTIKTERGDRTASKPTIIFSPAPGTHWLFYRRRLMILNRERQQLGQGATGTNKDPFREYFTVRILGRNRAVAMKLIEDACMAAHPKTVDKIVIRSARYGEWNASAWVPKRAANSVILSKGISDYLINDMKTFLNAEDFYLERGIPYQRGYLFYGPPGNGKTSSVMALATHFDMDVGYLNLKSGALCDDELSSALTNTPPNTLILIEDIDCVVKSREVDGAITFSGLLNALDGLGAAHGQIVFMTTNHREKLDEALIRPGRCDIQMEFPHADSQMAADMFTRFFPESGLAQEFSDRVEGEISMASLQKHLMLYRDDPREAVAQGIHAAKED